MWISASLEIGQRSNSSIIFVHKHIKYIFFLLLPHSLKGVIVMASFNNVSIFYIFLNTLLALRVWCCFYFGPLFFSILILSLHV